ncbi:MAG: hypothetical protein ABI614_27375, partial [Planctomycetota bacterium]
RHAAFEFPQRSGLHTLISPCGVAFCIDSDNSRSSKSCDTSALSTASAAAERDGKGFDNHRYISVV